MCEEVGKVGRLNGGGHQKLGLTVVMLTYHIRLTDPAGSIPTFAARSAGPLSQSARVQDTVGRASGADEGFLRSEQV